MFDLRKTFTKFPTPNENQALKETVCTAGYANSRRTAVASKTKSIQDELDEITKGGDYPDLSLVFHKLMEYNGKHVGNSEFKFPFLVGNLEKKDTVLGCVVRWNRYIIVDFNKQQLIKKHNKADKDDDKDNKVFDFANIVDVYRKVEKYENAFQEDANKAFKFVFFLKTTKKEYELYCSTEEERKLWMTCVKYSIEYAKTVEQRRAS